MQGLGKIKGSSEAGGGKEDLTWHSHNEVFF